jgi:hypothetical protein
MAKAFPAQLELAEKWIRQMGKEVHRVTLDRNDGGKEPALAVRQGSVTVHVRAEADCVVVFGLFPIPKEVRARLSALPGALQIKMLQALRRELLIHSRSAFGLAPPTVRDLATLEGFSIEQLLRVGDDDPSSFNRLADAIIEVTSDGLRGASVVGVALQSAGQETMNVNSKDVPDRMFG